MREEPHSAVVTELERRGYDLDDRWVTNAEINHVDHLDEDYGEMDSATLLNRVCIEGQVTDGLFENSTPTYDFTKFLTEFDGLVARMLYYMLSTQGCEYAYNDLVDDVEAIANSGSYEAMFDRDRALDARP